MKKIPIKIGILAYFIHFDFLTVLGEVENLNGWIG